MDHLILGLWPIAGVTTVGVTERDARETIAAALRVGIRRFDTAYSYGRDGESDRYLSEFLRSGRDRLEIIGKVGQRWDASGRRAVDASPETLRRDAETSLRRLGIERFDLLMLHQPDPAVDLTKSAETLAEMRRSGIAERVGLCNADETQRGIFASVVPCDAIQCPLNLLQREMRDARIVPANRQSTRVHVYWTLMKGLLAGKITPDHRFAAGDSRPTYPVFQGEARRRAHRIIDRLRPVGQRSERTIAQLAIGWAVSQQGVEAALVGARRPEQITEISGTTRLSPEVVAEIDRIVAEETDSRAG